MLKASMTLIVSYIASLMLFLLIFFLTILLQEICAFILYMIKECIALDL